MNRVYLRTSTDEQTTDSQRHALTAALAGAEAVFYDDSGYTGANQDRPDFQRLMKDLKPGDSLYCYAIDRLSREGIVAALSLWTTFKAKGVKLVSISEPWLDPSNPCADVVLSVMAWAAEQERRRIKARQRAGIAAARAKNGGKVPWGGRKVGARIRLTTEKEETARQVVGAGKSVASVARQLGLSRKTVYVALGRQTA